MERVEDFLVDDGVSFLYRVSRRLAKMPPRSGMIESAVDYVEQTAMLAKPLIYLRGYKRAA